MHSRQECKHGVVYSQCRCPGPVKSIDIVPCEWTHCSVKEGLTDDEITSIAYAEIFDSARSMLDFWIDEEGEYSEQDFEKIRKRCSDLINELEQKYV